MDSVSQYIEQRVRLGANAEVADALRRKREPILRRFSEAATETLSVQDAEFGMAPVLDEITVTLERPEEGRWVALAEVAAKYGVECAREERGVERLFGEYRLLRSIIIDEMHEGLRRGEFAFPGTQLVAADAVLDAAMQRSASAFASHREAELRKRLDAETKYLSFLSHDLRNNMNGIILGIDALTEQVRDRPELREECEMLLAGRGAIWDTMEGMQRLMEAERMKRSKVELKVVSLTLHAAVDNFIANLRRRARTKGLAMENRIDPAIVLDTDEQLLRLIVQNLVGNALRYTDKGTVTLLVEPEQDGRQTLVVADTGRGIPPEEQHRVFDAFQRGETHPEKGGMGLGLTIVRAASMLLGAQLRMETSLGKGTTFRVTLCNLTKPAAAKAGAGAAT